MAALARLLLLAAALACGGVAVHGLAAGERPAAASGAALDPPGAPTAGERVLGEIATVLARRPVGVRCDGAELPDLGPTVAVHGVVRFHGGRPANYTTISPTLCRELLDLRRSGLRADEARCVAQWAGLGCGGRIARRALALATLAHESFHLAGVRDEGAADCYAIQSVAFVALRLGLPPDQAAGLAAYAKVDHRVGQAAPYRSDECREGGALDLDPAGAGGLG